MAGCSSLGEQSLNLPAPENLQIFLEILARCFKYCSWHDTPHEEPLNAFDLRQRVLLNFSVPAFVNNFYTSKQVPSWVRFDGYEHCLGPF